MRNNERSAVPATSYKSEMLKFRNFFKYIQKTLSSKEQTMLRLFIALAFLVVYEVFTFQYIISLYAVSTALTS